GRRRWHRNDQIAEQVKQLGDFLIIGGYEESHATRYGKLAHTISRHRESIVRLYKEGRLGKIPGVGGTIAKIVSEFLETGTCTKMEEWTKHTPKAVLELTTIPGLGAKTARTLYQEHGIASLDALREALDNGELDGVKGMGRKTIETIQKHIWRKRRG
ncbi:MAG: helix-hairpin-helix domain-containing protein, partial [Candidatus Binatia bacterium]